MSVFCKKPYILSGHAFGCGQCMPCLVNRRRVWTHRIMLEASLHASNCFLTLTYVDESMPEGENLVPRDMMLFMKRLRKVAGRGVRFYGCGEYGEKTLRPHYHIALFGIEGCIRGVSDFRQLRGRCCDVCERYREVWGKGNVFLGQLESKSASYVAGYVSKSRSKEESVRIDNRVREFARMSNRPGIGCDFMDEVASTLLEHGLVKELADVPVELRHGKVKWPLGRYLRMRLRERIGRDAKAPKEAYDQMEREVQIVRDYARNVKAKTGGKYEDALRGVIQDLGEGRRLQIEAKERFRKRGVVQ